MVSESGSYFMQPPPNPIKTLRTCFKRSYVTANPCTSPKPPSKPKTLNLKP